MHEIDIEGWKLLATNLKSLKEQEAEMRRDICSTLIEGQELKNGRLTVNTVIDNYKVRAIQTVSYNVDQAAVHTLWQHMTDAEKEAIRWKAELKLREYKTLVENSLIHEAITSRLAMPTLEATHQSEQ